MNGTATTCVGVMPPRFQKQAADLWRPIRLDRADPVLSRQYFVFQAKLKPGVTLEKATAQMDVVARRIATVYPDNYPPRFTVHVVSWVDGIVSRFRGTLYTLFAAVVLLLIACSNVANMLLARAAAREKEMAIRTSIGASRWLLIRQLLVESLLLAFAGAVLGCVFAYIGIKGVTGLIPQGLIPSEAVIRLNLPVLIFSLAIAVFTAVAVRARARAANRAEKHGGTAQGLGRGVIGGFRRGKLRSTLVVVEVALSLVLLAGAGLLMRNFVRLQSLDLGFNPNNVLVARLPLPPGQVRDRGCQAAFLRSTVAAAERASWSGGGRPPPHRSRPMAASAPIWIFPGKTHTERWNGIFQLCSEGYFPTLGLKLLRGRTLSDVDVRTARKVTVVNQTFVSKFFGAEDPIGQPGEAEAARETRGWEQRGKPGVRNRGCDFRTRRTAALWTRPSRNCSFPIRSPGRSHAASW